MERPTASIEAVLLFLEGENTGSEIKVDSSREFIIGRSEACDIYIGEKKVSRKHANIHADHDGLILEDLESTNGTFVDGKKITSVKLKDGDTVRIGMTVFKVSLIEGRALSSEGELVSDFKKDPKMTIENPSVEIPLPADEEEKPFDIMSSDDEASYPEDEEAVVDLEKIKSEEIKPDKKEQSLSQSQAKGVDKKKPLSGDLSEMYLPDILQMLKGNSRSGVLEITAGDESGRIFFVEGKLEDVQWMEIKGLKAIYRMLSFNEGNFEFQSLPESFSVDNIREKIDLSLENIQIEGMRQLDELEKLKKGLPKPNAKLDVNRKCSQPLSKLHPKVLDILQLVISYENYTLVLNKSQLSDLETGKIVYYLLKKGYVVSK